MSNRYLWKILFIGIALLAPVFLSAETLNVGLYQPIIKSSISKKDFIIGMTVFIKEFAESEGIKTNVMYYDDPIKLSEDFKSGKVDFVAAEAMFFVQYIPPSLLRNGTMAYKNSKKDSHTLLLLEQKNDSRPLKEKLKGTITTDGDQGEDLYLKTLMLENGLGDSPDLLLTKNTQQSILKLFFGKADMALVDLSSYKMALELNPQLGEKLAVHSTIPFPIGPVSYMNANYSPITQKKVIGLGKILNTTERGKQILRVFQSSYMDESDTKDLDNAYALYAKYQTLLKQQNRLKKGK
jgi:hypothetical protein